MESFAARSFLVCGSLLFGPEDLFLAESSLSASSDSSSDFESESISDESKMTLVVGSNSSGNG